MVALEEPSNRRSRIGGIVEVDSAWVRTNLVSIKQCVEPESTSALKGPAMAGDVTGRIRELGSERADALIRNSVAQLSSTQSSACAET